MIALLLASVLAAAPSNAPLRRVALLVGANDGGATRPQLRYAVSDAQSFGKLLGDLGGVSMTDRRMLENPSAAQLRDTLEHLVTELGAISPQEQRLEVVLYYSGHSDEEGLLLKGERFTYSELRQWLGKIPSAVRVAILDSCASGALTRRKGGTQVPPFLVDASSTVQGQAILTSSSETEASQESDRIGGSFFTHYLLSGLRGAADASHDGRVTLNEAYQFTFDETLAGTEKTRSGPQHPAFDIQLVGTGDFVMTDLRTSGATLVLPEQLLGRFFVRDDGGRLVAELRKFAGNVVELALEPGHYTITRGLDGAVSEGQFMLEAQSRVPLYVTAFTTVKKEPTLVRGNDTEPTEYHWAPVDLLPIPLGSDRKTLNNFALNFFAGSTDKLDGLALSLGGHWTRETMRGVQLSVGFVGSGGPAHGLQGAVGAVYAGGEFVGLQTAVGGARAESLRGIQASTGLNLVSQSVRGAQFAVGANSAGTGLFGAQFSVGANVAGGSENTGLQVAAGVNYASGTMRGLQLSSGVNVASDLSGGQIGLVNVGGEVRGLQVGLVNVAKNLSGFQLALVNVADTADGASVGLLSIIGDGMHRAEVWSGDSALVNIGFKLGTKRVYSLLTAGLLDSQHWEYGVGLGVHFPTSTGFAFNLDAVVHTVSKLAWVPSSGVWTSLRVLAEYQFFQHLRVFAGPTFNISSPYNGQRLVLSRIPGWTVGNQTLWVGAVAGASF